ncbi:hypothetical protein ANN_08126 [Periplaneta americana]|uniref:Uncharacterized protein n=1 Tax=Periplaneta americana TaxID=6978 RepID=A0ABQ8T2T2_PERAM|nr:hypothetical protein ANN_08126 [Periplaneta americana]
MDLREVGYDDRDWIDLAQDRDHWRAYVTLYVNADILRSFAESKTLKLIGWEVVGTESIGSVLVTNGDCLQMGKRKLWSKDEMMEAVKHVREIKMGYKLVSNRHQPTQVTEHQDTELETSNSVISPEDIRKVPVIEPSFSNRRGSALIVTSTTHKNNLHTAAEKKS